MSLEILREIDAALAPELRIRSYRIDVRHEESLHPHDAVAAVMSPTWPRDGRTPGTGHDSLPVDPR